MNRKERIYNFIKSKEYIPLKFSELMMVLEVPKEDSQKLSDLLDSLVGEGRITRSKRGRYLPCADNVITGTLRCNASGKFGFVTPDEEGTDDIFVPKSKMRDAVHMDRVLVEIEEFSSHRNSREGFIKKVISRGATQITGVVERMRHKVYKIRPDDARFFSYPRVSPGNMMDARVGDRVLVEVSKVDNKGDIYGRVITNFGNGRDINSSVSAILAQYNIKTEFDVETIKEAEGFSPAPTEADLAGRLDLRNQLIFTIDGDDAKDFDDAISLEKTDGGYRLGVHIADVSHYVKEHSAIDNEAFLRATSVYIPGRVIPMLPEVLSNGLCSLNPNADRLTLSVIMEISRDGDVLSHTLTESVISSKYRLTYNDVNKLLDGDSAMSERYSDISDTLFDMAALAEILNNKRKRRGAFNFDFSESAITLDDSGYPTDIGIYERGVSNRMIEEFMLTANETVAEYAFWSEIPFVYRIHEAPPQEKMEAFRAYALRLGYSLKGKFDKKEPIHPKSLCQILEKVSGKPEERAISKNILQSLAKAEYSPENSGHFGLAAKYYCHFTSPIRRYPDLAIHRILKAFISGHMKKDFSHFAAAAADKSTEREIAAQSTERDVDDTLKAFYMSKHLGKTFDGTVSGITSFGMFVELDNTVEGLIRLADMSDDYYSYNEADMSLTGERTGEEFHIGDRVVIRVAGSDPVSRQIDFELRGRKNNG